MLKSLQSVLRRSVSLLSVVGALSYSALAPALGLGDITLHSALNQPLNAEITLVDPGALSDGELSVSLATVAAGLIVCYLLWDIRPQTGRTMNASLSMAVFAGWPGATALVWCAMLSAAALLVAAAQAGFVGGPRVVANMAVDGWMPRKYAALSERLTTGNAVLLITADRTENWPRQSKAAIARAVAARIADHFTSAQ